MTVYENNMFRLIPVLTINVSYIDVRPNTPFSLAWLVAGSFWYWTDYGTIQTVLLGAAPSHVPAPPAARQSFGCKWGALL